MKGQKRNFLTAHDNFFLHLLAQKQKHYFFLVYRESFPRFTLLKYLMLTSDQTDIHLSFKPTPTVTNIYLLSLLDYNENRNFKTCHTSCLVILFIYVKV